MNDKIPTILPYEDDTNMNRKKLRKENALSLIHAMEKHPNVSFVQLRKILAQKYGDITATMVVQDAEFILKQMKLANIANQELAMYKSR